MTTPAKPALPEPDGYFYEVDSYFGVHRQFDTTPYNGMRPHRTVGYFTADTMNTAIDAAVAEARAVPKQAFGIIDPDYARVFTQARILAWQHGYACLAHGSFTRDLDLLLVPWTDAAQADDVDYFAPRIAEAAGLKVSPHPPSAKPHGRKTWTLLFPGFSDARWVDLSVLTPLTATPSPAEQPKPAVPEPTRSQKLADAGFTRRPSLWAMQAREALELIAAPRRPDGTWNRDREACRQLAAEALGRDPDDQIPAPAEQPKLATGPDGHLAPASEGSPGGAVVELPDRIRVPLHRLWADAGYLIGRARNGETDLAVHTIKALCDELERAIRAALAQSAQAAMPAERVALSEERAKRLWADACDRGVVSMVAGQLAEAVEANNMKDLRWPC